MLGIRTQGRRMVGTDKTMELWRPLKVIVTFLLKNNEPILMTENVFEWPVCLHFSVNLEDRIIAIRKTRLTCSQS